MNTDETKVVKEKKPLAPHRVKGSEEARTFMKELRAKKISKKSQETKMDDVVV